ncbi:MAG TPA: hypothetical protein VF939_06755 [Puia sp.]
MSATKKYVITSKKKKKRIVFVVMMVSSSLPEGDSPFSEKDMKEEGVRQGEAS